LPQSGTVRIVVVQPGTEASGASLPALQRLGAEVALETVWSPDRALERARETELDLVVVEPGVDGAGLDRLLEGLREAGPPVIVVARGAVEEVAVDLFRRGAADCVTLDGDADEALPVAALDQIRRFRALRSQRSAERRIATLRRYTRNIIQNINSAMLVVDTQCRVTYANAGAGDLLGEPAERLSGRRASDWFSESDSGTTPLLRTLEKGEHFRGAESWVVRADGTRVPVSVHASPMRDDDGRDLGAVAILQDLSQTRELQRQILQSEKLASIGQLAAGVAHEINNPAGFIDANLFQMEEYVGDLRRVWKRVQTLRQCAEMGDLGAVRREARELAAVADDADVDFLLDDLGKALRESREGSERIRHIVQDLRAFAKPDASERTWADVNQCLDSTANIAWSMMKHSVELRKEYGDLPELLCYPGQLRQVFMNLLMNAYQAVEDRLAGAGAGGVGTIGVRTEASEGEIVVTVEDDGVGIDPSLRDRIFDPFFTTREVGHGTGLGLSTAFSVVRAHGGTLSAGPREPRGTVFRVTLPVRPPGTADPAGCT